MATFKEEDFTEWFGPEFVPGQIGVFQTRHHPEGVIVFRHWDGKDYGMAGFSPDAAKRESHIKTTSQNLWFRGLKEDPSELIKALQ